MFEPTASVKGTGGLLARLDAAVSELRAAVGAIDPAVVTGSEAERLMAPLSQARNVCAGGLAALAARVADTGRWKQAEATSPEAHVGSLTGESAGSGRRLLDAGRKLEDAPGAKRALGAGKLSLDQAAEIASAVSETAASADPEVAGRAGEVEARLLEVAEAGDLARLRDAAAKAKQAARDEAHQRRVQHDTRHLRRRAFDDGSVGGSFKLPPGVASEVWGVLDRLTAHHFDRARRAGVRYPRDAYAADALCTAIGVAPSVHPDRVVPVGAGCPTDERQGRARAVPEPQVNLHKELVVVVDAASLINGRLGPDGTCEIPGVGPVPVQTARELLGDAGVSIVVTKGVDIANVTLGGRRLSKSMRLAMLASGRWRCGDCGTPYRLQGDHDEPFALSQHTKLDELIPRCPVCHDRKSRREAPRTIAAGRARARQSRSAQRRVAAAVIAALSLTLLSRGP